MLFFKVILFFLTTCNSNGNLYLALCLVGKYSVAPSTLALTIFFIFVIWIMCFRCPLKNIKFVFYTYHMFITYISMGK